MDEDKVIEEIAGKLADKGLASWRTFTSICYCFALMLLALAALGLLAVAKSTWVYVTS